MGPDLHHAPPAPGGRAGFLLLETLLTVLILTAGLTIVVRSFGSSFDALRTSRDYTKAMLLVDQRMGEVEALGTVRPGATTGRFAEDGGFEWEVRIAEPDLAGLCETRVTVLWQQQGRSRSLSLATYLKAEGRRA